jgi:hypothetical protein
MPKARYQVVDEQLEDQQMPSQVFAQSAMAPVWSALPTLQATSNVPVSRRSALHTIFVPMILPDCLINGVFGVHSIGGASGRRSL